MDPALDKASASPQVPQPPVQGWSSPPSGTAQEFRLRVLKEPRGFLRVIEFVLAVCMFATTGGYATYFIFSVSCRSMPYRIDVTYPFVLDAKPLPTLCNDTHVRHASSNPSSSAEFFVAVGVLAMLYTIGSLIWYIIFEAKYLEKGFIFVCDLVISGVFVLLFFISSCAWAAGLNDVKYWTNLKNLANDERYYKGVCDAYTCSTTKSANYASLNVSVIFGFLNTVVWAGNLWFIYKETTWFQQRMQQKQSTGEKPVDPNAI